MYMTLNAPAIGIKEKSLSEIIDLARGAGFAGVDFNIAEAKSFADTNSVAALKDLFGDIRPAQWGLPVIGEQTEWDIDLKALEAGAKLSREIGCTRVATWVPSWSDTRDLDENIDFHITRMRPVAQVLGDQGCALGLEFLGPKTLLDGHKYTFIRTMDAMLDMCREIGNAGLLLDAWHLYTSGGTTAELSALKLADVVHVHINDAPLGVSIDDQIDSVRCLPMETGVIDLVGFMKELVALGYDGPVVTEPFNAPLNDLASRDPLAAASSVSAEMKKLWQASGLQL